MVGPGKVLSKEESRLKAIADVEAIFERYHLLHASLGTPLFDENVMKNAVILDASLGPPHEIVQATGRGQTVPPPPNAGIISSSTCKLHIGQEYANLNNVMHGGAAGVIFDMLTTIALGPVAKPGFWSFLGGVTRTLNINYLKAVPVDTTVIVHACVYQIGKQSAYIKGWMTSEDGRITYAACEHNKIHVPTPEKHLEQRIPWDDQWDDRKSKTSTTSKL